MNVRANKGSDCYDDYEKSYDSPDEGNRASRWHWYV